ncbi:dynactin-associated protein-like [Pteropus alecto]|uniref:dynactin-associated protein-like n=1 Tax=Pteropus alecto TaxID=9402 RepID=UPI0007685C06|nr:dynactin-associated protein-like [Pteropus alecto]
MHASTENSPISTSFLHRKGNNRSERDEVGFSFMDPVLVFKSDRRKARDEVGTRMKWSLYRLRILNFIFKALEEVQEETELFLSTRSHEAHSSACQFPPSTDVTSDVGTNLTSVCTNTGTLGCSEFPNRELQHYQETCNVFSDWSLWKIFLACLLACVITTTIGVLIVCLVYNGKNNNASVVTQLPTTTSTTVGSTEPTTTTLATTSTEPPTTAASTTTESTTRTVTTEASTGSTSTTGTTHSTEPPTTTASTITDAPTTMGSR